MRTTNIGNISVIYPDTTAYLHDNIFVGLTSGNGSRVGAKIQVNEASSGRWRKLQYMGETPELVFNLNDSVQSLYNEGVLFNITIQLYENGAVVGDFGFDTNIMNGRTLPLRAHGSARTIYVYGMDDLYKVGFVFPASGSLSVNGHGLPITSGGYTSLDLRPYIATTGEYSLCFEAGTKGEGQGKTETQNTISVVNVGGITPFSATAQLYYADTSGKVPSGDKGGGIWKEDEFYLESYCVNLIYSGVCDDFNFFETRYRDTDGIMRYLGGKVVEETTESKGENYYRMDTSTVIRNISRRHVNDTSDTVKVAYGELRRDSYWNDILLADKVEFRNYNGEWVECSVRTNKVTLTSEETQDVEIEYEILKG